MEAAQWPAEGSRVSATARALGRKGRATASGPAANRWPRTAARRSISAPRGAGSGRVCGPRMRSEERRVGKECRYRWESYPKQKKVNDDLHEHINLKRHYR